MPLPKPERFTCSCGSKLFAEVGNWERHVVGARSAFEDEFQVTLQCARCQKLWNGRVEPERPWLGEWKEMAQ
jgi:hypothetical protein